jgi:hypothetical protein
MPLLTAKIKPSLRGEPGTTVYAADEEHFYNCVFEAVGGWIKNGALEVTVTVTHSQSQMEHPPPLP